MNIPRPEHPIPQFYRENWLNLNGEWDFQIDRANSGMDRKLYEADVKFDSKIIVPFCPESELSGVCDKDFMDAVWYQREIEIPAEHSNRRALLHFGAVDFTATVYVNGKKVGQHKGGYISFTFDITDYLTDGKNILTVCAQDDVRNPYQARGKQSEKYYSHDCDYTRTTGIWQTVWLEFVPDAYIKNFKIFPHVDNCSVDITAQIVGSGNFEVEASYEGKPMGKTCVCAKSGNTVTAHIDLSEEHLWEVGNGRLYDLTLTFNDDKVSSYFGLREVKLDGFKFLINGKSVFQRLVLDQGFYPDGIYTAPTEEAIIKDIQISLDAGFNGARLHQKIFEPRFLYHCDKMGYIVWGEYPNWGSDHTDPVSLYNVLSEWIEEVNRDFNHPAIIGWCPYNETWDIDGKEQYDDILATIYKTTKAMDTTRPCIDTSGNFHVMTDIFDVHDYEQDPEVFRKCYEALETDGTLFDRHDKRQHYNGEATFVSEYGGIKWSPIEADSKTVSWGYGNAPKTEEEFIARYKGLTDTLLDNEKMLGFCYTQLYDIEQEQNGLYYYDRTPKFDMSIFKAINERQAKIEK